ncbi:MAG: hypothetical protein D6751_11820, partial [Deltaproteobacteria bacterium]
MHTVELARFLQEAGYAVRLFAPRYAPWQIGRVDADCPFPVTLIPFTGEEWNRAVIKRKLREAVTSFGPEAVILTDTWNMRPHLTEALAGYPVFQRLQAQECLCPLNNLRLRPTAQQGWTLCPHRQPAAAEECRTCLRQHGSLSGDLHRAERELAGVEEPGYAGKLRDVFRHSPALLTLNPDIADLWRPFCNRVEVVPWGMDPARFAATAKEPPLSATDGRLRLLFAGLTNEFFKGFPVLREACRQLWQRRQDFELIVTDEERPAEEPFLRFIGWQSQQQLPRWYARCDV